MVTPARRSTRKGAGRNDLRASPAPSTASAASQARRSNDSRGVKRKAESVKEEQPTPPPSKKLNQEEKPKNRPSQDFSNSLPRLDAISSVQTQECEKIVDVFYGSRKEKFSIFYAPVDVEALNLPDYYKIIETPMDLQTVKDKLKFQQYANVEEFAEDMRLIADNCIKYNGAASSYGRIASEFLRLFEKHYDFLPVHRRQRKSFKTEPMANFAASTPAKMPLKSVAAVASRSTSKTSGAVDDNNQLEALLKQVVAESEALKKRMEECDVFKQELQKLMMDRMNAVLHQEAPQLSSERHSALQEFLAKSISAAPTAASQRTRNSTSPPHAKKDQMVSSPVALQSTSANAAPTEETTAEHSEEKPVAVVAPQVQAQPRKGRKRGSKNKKKKDGYTFDSGDEGNHEEMTFEEKRELSMKIGTICGGGADVMVKIYNIIKSREQIDEANAEEVEVDLETMKPVTLRELDAFVGAFEKKNKPKRKRTHRTPAKKAVMKEPENQINSSNGTQNEPSSSSALSNGPNADALLRSLELSESSSGDSSDSSSSEDDDDESERAKVPPSKSESTVAPEESDAKLPDQNDSKSFAVPVLPPSNDQKKQQTPRAQAAVKPLRPAVSQTNAMNVDPLEGLIDDPPTKLEPPPAAPELHAPPVDLGKSIELMANFDADF